MSLLKFNIFVEKAKLIHGEKYIYPHQKYKNNRTKIVIVCKKCICPFEQTPKNHLNKHGCPKCAIIKKSDRCRKSLDEFIKNANKIHNFKYDYSEAYYKNANTKIIIICKIHGEFLQSPSSHINKKCGCSKCSGKYNYTIEEFIEKAKEIHGDKYDYSKAEYINANTKIIIVCKIHEGFLQSPDSHINKNGCPKCANIKTGDRCRKSLEEFIENANKIHNFKYDYSKAYYKNNRTKIIIICKIHGGFLQSPDNHLNNKQDCPKCQSSKGEKLISKILTENKIRFIPQYKFPNQQKEIKRCSYDFYLPEINTIIEYHGEQHYKFNKHFHRTNDNFIKRWYYDILKKEFCIRNNIKFIEIRYDEDIKNKLLTENII